MRKPLAPTGRRPALWLSALVIAGLLVCLVAVLAPSPRARADSEVGSPPDGDLLVAVPSDDGSWSYVRVDFLMTLQATQAERDAARSAMLERFPGALVVGPGGVSAAYVLTGFKWASGSATWAYNPAGGPALAGASNAVAAGAATWSATGANFHFLGGGGTSNTADGCSAGSDGASTVGWASQSPGVLAVTCTRSAGGSAKEFDMQISPNQPWTTGSPPSADLQSVALHEFGHALGLGHSSLPQAVMFPSYAFGTLKRVLDADDIAGELAVYGGGSGATPTFTPTATPSPTSTPKPPATATPTTPAGIATPTTAPASSPSASPRTSPAASSPPPTSPPTATPSTAAGAPNAPPGEPGRTLALQPGANLLVWPGATVRPSAALAVAGAVQIVYSWDADKGAWERWATALPEFANTLQFLVQGRAYWFISISAAQVTFAP